MTDKPSTPTQVKLGQLWSDNDGRGERIVCIRHLFADGMRVEIQRVTKEGMAWYTKRRGAWSKIAAPRVTTSLSRFGLKGRNGYTLHKDVP